VGRLAYPSPDPGDRDAFLQARVTRVLGSVAALLGVFLVYGLIEPVLDDDHADVSRAGWIFHVASVVLVTLAALYCSRGERTVRQSYAADLLGTLTATVFLGLMSSQLNIGYRPELTMLLGCTLMVVTRSAFVPSTAARTALLCALVAAPVAAVSWYLYLGHAPPPGYPVLSSIGVTIFILLWWAASSAIAVSISHVIFGLRSEVTRAKRLGQYALEEKIGEGGMGRVYRASHAMLRRPTAIKLLIDAGEADVARFEREVQITACLTHPNTVAIFDYGRTPDGTFYYAMEYLDGWSLDDLVASHGPLPAGRVIHILAQVCGALAEAHAAGLIHRDIKPANILVCERGGVADVAKVLDFGLVKAIDAPASASTTTTNQLLGTPLYMSPEAIKNPDGMDARSDLYGLGAVAYYLLTGSPPFEGDSIVEVCGHHLHTRPEPPSRRARGVPSDLEAVVLSCLAKAAADRPRDAVALAAALRACRDDGAWSPADALAWWSEHHRTPNRSQGHVAGDRPRTAETVAIDLSARSVAS
jgi:eukaryotic-like serine/threonine-protein kinase